jgi:diguanylate cyclase (GGDEF)-like protein
MVVLIVIIFKDPKDRPLNLIAAGLIGLALLQLTVALPIRVPVPMVMQYSVLIAAIFFGLQFILDFKAVFHERDNLRKSYNKDTLTDAYSRRALDDINPGSFSSAVFLDLDEFKYYNDRYGHEKGDEVLKGFVSLANSLLRQEDIVVRYGGDEFLILLKETDEKAVKGVVERIRRQFKNSIEDKNIDISYGISQIHAGTELDIDELDRKMYAMKQSRKKSRKLQLI